MKASKRLQNSIKKSPSSYDNPKKKFCEKENLPKTFSPAKLKKLLDDDFEYFDEFLIEDESIGNVENKPNNSGRELNKKLFKINLTEWTRCRVTNIRKDLKNFDIILNLRKLGESCNDEEELRLQGPWINTKAELNEIVSVLAIWNGGFVINKDSGFIVTNPDFLVSSTSVVGSLFCQRRSVLQDKFRGIDDGSKIMIIGSIVHELFQVVLAKKLKTFEEIENEAMKYLNSKDMMHMLYSAKMNFIEAEAEIRKFLPNIYNFIQQYVFGCPTTEIGSEGFKGLIDSVQDIEENLWIPQLGLKGKVDVSVRVHKRELKNRIFKPKSLFMPLELKTGKASFSMEHKGQLILYQMMLTEVGEKPDSGLLLYLKDGIMKEIQPSRNEQRDLIMMRNDLAYYLTRNIQLKKNLIEQLDQQFENFQLPEPINYLNACTKCPYNTICSSFLVTDKTNQLSENHPMKIFSKECTEHLKPTDLEYFIFWCGLLSLEEQETKKVNQLNALWTELAESRRNKGCTIINLKINGKVESNNGKFIHTFQMDEVAEIPQTGMKLDFTLSGISVGDYVIISSSKRLAIASGYVYDLKNSSIILNLERNLSLNYSNEIFIIDKRESQSNNIFNYTNLGLLLDCTEKSTKLRQIIIDLVKPEFSSVLPKIVAREGVNILIDLNQVQRKAVMKALTSENYMLIKGLPGTGKTQTLVAIIRLLHLMGKRILITSHTHSAVDNLLLRIKSHKLSFLRLGSETKIDPQLREFSELSAIGNCTDSDELAKIYSSFQIVGVTCLGCSHPIFNRSNLFDVCIVDEATQVYQPTVIRALYFVNKFILVGDPDQLPPLVRSRNAQNLGSDKSLFHRLDSEEATSILTHQYRMNKTITKLANDLTYNGNLVCANENILQSSLDIPKRTEFLQKFSTKKWLLRVLEKHVDQSVIVVDTGDCLSKSMLFSDAIKLNLREVRKETFFDSSKLKNEKINKYTNYCDAAIIFTLVKSLLIGGYDADKIGIIAPFRAQVDLLKKIKEDFEKFFESSNLKFRGLEVNTIDQYQGRDKEVVLYSCCKTGCHDDFERSVENEILEDRRRLTVAITRSKHKLIIVGDQAYLQKYTPFRDMFEKISGRCKIKLDDGKMGFSWDDSLTVLTEVL